MQEMRLLLVQQPLFITKRAFRQVTAESPFVVFRYIVALLFVTSRLLYCLSIDSTSSAGFVLLACGRIFVGKF